MKERKFRQEGFAYLEIILIIVIVLILAFVGWYVYESQHKTNDIYKSISSTNIQPVTTSASKYNGTYKGMANVANGLANVSVTVSGSKLSGTATYYTQVNNQTYTLPATIQGTINSKGAITGTVTVSGSILGTNISLSGPATGQVSGKNINATYSLTGNYTPVNDYNLIGFLNLNKLICCIIPLNRNRLW